MRNSIKKILSVLMALCTLISIISFSAKADTSTDVLTDNSLYLLYDNLIFEVSEKTAIDEFSSNFINEISVFTEKDSPLASDKFISTGCYFKHNDVKYTVIITGDVDSSGTVDSTDYMRVKSHFLSLIFLSSSQAKAADVDNSGAIDSTDYLKIKSSFLGSYLLPSSTEYSQRKGIVSNLLKSAEKLSLLSDLNVDININSVTDTGNFHINGSLVAVNVGSFAPDFSFFLNASSQGITYPLSETYYVDNTLYTQNGEKKYKTNASFADVSEFLSNYVLTSPVTPEGNFIIVPSIDKERVLGKEYATLSSILKSVSLSFESGNVVYNIETDNILNTDLFYELFLDATGSTSFGSMNIRDAFEKVFISGKLKANNDGILYESLLELKVIVKDTAIAQLGVGTPKNMTVDFNVKFKNIGGTSQVSAPDASLYTTTDNLYTPYAFTAYDNVFEVASAISADYNEALNFGSISASSSSTTNAKNVSNGVELHKSTQTTINGSKDKSELYIGNSKYITSNNGVVSSSDINTETLSLNKTGLFITPQFAKVNDITKFDSFSLVENGDNYTLNYTLAKSYAIELLKNSDIIKKSTFSTDLGIYSHSQYTLTSSSGSITFTKHTFEVLSNKVETNFTLSDGKTLSYSYDFSVNTTNYSSVSVDNALLGN